MIDSTAIITASADDEVRAIAQDDARHHPPGKSAIEALKAAQYAADMVRLRGHLRGVYIQDFVACYCATNHLTIPGGASDE